VLYKEETEKNKRREKKNAKKRIKYKKVLDFLYRYNDTILKSSERVRSSWELKANWRQKERAKKSEITLFFIKKCLTFWRSLTILN